MHCRSCRHWRRIPASVVRARLTVEQDGHQYSLAHLPGIAQALDRDDHGACSLRDCAATADATCEHHSLRVLGWLRPGRRFRDAAARVKIAMDAERRAAEREATLLAEAARPVVDVECPLCHRMHERCKVCHSRMMMCGMCPACGGIVAMMGRAGTWLCRRCGLQGADVLAPLTYGPTGTCEGCRDTLAGASP